MQLAQLQNRLLHLDQEKELLIRNIVMHYQVGELIMYRANPNPIVEALQLARIVEVLPYGLNVERYRPDGSKMRGLGHIRESVLVSVRKCPELDVDSL